MLLITLRSLRARTTRLLLSGLAIVLGVAFVSGSLVFTHALDRAFQGVMNGSVPDVVVRPVETGPGPHPSSVPTSLVARVRAVPGVVRVEPDVLVSTTFVLDRQGKVLGGQGAPGIGTGLHGAPAAGGVPGLRILTGRAPHGAGQVAIDPQTARRGGYRIGDEVTVVTTGPAPRVRARLVGLAGYAEGSTAGASLVVWDVPTAQRLSLPRPGTATRLWVVTDQRRGAPAVAAAVARVLPPGYEAPTGAEVAAQNATAVRRALGFIGTFLLVFAGIAVVVGAFLILNTFAMLGVQRARELALLRALGATRRQVTRSVLLEALLVGLVAATAGLGLGLVLATGIREAFARLGLDIGGQPLRLTPTAVAAGYAVGVVATLLAAWLPARRSARVAPAAALADEAPVPPERSLWLRALAGVLTAGAGALLLHHLLTGRRTHEDLMLGAGLLLCTLGAVLVAPALVRPVVGTGAAVLGLPFGAVGRLARRNALRRPRRTAATASALMIGMALVSMATVFGASASRSVTTLLGDSFVGDYVVSNALGVPFPAAVTERVAGTPGVAAVVRTRFAPATLDGATTTLSGIDPQEARHLAPLRVRQGSTARFAGAAAVVSDTEARRLGLTVGRQVQVSVGGRRVVMPVVAVVERSPVVPQVGTTLEGFVAAGGQGQDSFVYAARRPGADPQAVRRALTERLRAVPVVSVKDQAEFEAEQREVVDRLLRTVYAMLGLAVLIAVLGIVNTLALSVTERRREIGLLRALGLTRRQLRRSIRLESVAISLLGALLGITLGVGAGVVLVRSQAEAGISELVVPWPQVALFAALAALAGVGAAWWPSVRAARTDVLDAIGSV